MLKGFHQWLMSAMKFPKASADSYCRGIGSINEDVYKPATQGKDMFVALGNTISTGCAVDWLMALEGILNYQIEQASKPDKKPLQEKRCRLRKFREYVEILQCEEANDCHNFNPKYIPGGLQLFDRESIRKLVTARLALSDVMTPSASVILPLSMFFIGFARASTRQKEYSDRNLVNIKGKPINLLKLYKEWINFAFSKVLFRTTRGYYRMDEINAIIIDGIKKKGYVRVGKNKYELVYETNDCKFEPMHILTMKDIHFNFGTAYLKEFAKNIHEYPALKSFSDTLLSAARQELTPTGNVNKSRECVIRSTDMIRIFENSSELRYMLPHVVVDLIQLSNRTQVVAKPSKHPA